MTRVDPEERARFSTWLEADVRGNGDYSKYTLDQVIEWAWQNRCLDAILDPPNRMGPEAMSFREYIAINNEPSRQGNPFPDMRRKGETMIVAIPRHSTRR